MAGLFGVHRNTVRHWLGNGLKSISAGGMTLILGEELRRFHTQRRADRRAKCPPGTMYCLRCRAPRSPPEGLTEATTVSPTTVNLRGLCPNCGCLMHRRAALARLAAAGFGGVPIRQAGPDLADSQAPSLNCHPEKDR